MQNANTVSRAAASALDFLERLANFPFVLLLLAFTLALDITLSVFYDSTVLSNSWHMASDRHLPAIALVFLVLFGLFMTIGAGIARLIIERTIILTLFGPILQHVFALDDAASKGRSGEVTIWQLRDAAHAEENLFYLNLYRERIQEIDELSRLSASAFACLLLLTTDSIILPLMGYPSAAASLSFDSPELYHIGYTAITLALLTVWLLPLLKNNEWVYCPPLYRKLQNVGNR